MKLEIIKGQRGYAFDMIRDAETLGQVAFSADPDLTALFAAAPEMYESLRDAVLFMQFLGKKERPLSAEEQEWLNKAVSLLDKIEGGGE